MTFEIQLPLLLCTVIRLIVEIYIFTITYLCTRPTMYHYSSYILRRSQKLKKKTDFGFDRPEFPLQYEIGAGRYACVNCVRFLILILKDNSKLGGNSFKSMYDFLKILQPSQNIWTLFQICATSLALPIEIEEIGDTTSVPLLDVEYGSSCCWVSN